MEKDQMVRFSDRSTDNPQYQNRIGYFQRMEGDLAVISASRSDSGSVGETIRIPIADCKAI